MRSHWPTVRRWILPVLPLALAWSLYAPVLDFGLVYDDHDAIEANTAVTSCDLLALWTTPFWGRGEADRVATWRPLTSLTFAVERQIGLLIGHWSDGAATPQPAITGDHKAIAIALHAGNLFALLATIAALWWLLSTLGGNLGVRLTATVLFAVHPLLTEAVAFTVARADLQSACLGMLFLGAWIRDWPIRAAFFFAGALWTKDSAVVLLAIALAWSWSAARMPDATTPERQVVRRQWIGAACVLCLWFAARIAVLGSLTGAPATVVENPVVAADAVGRLLAALIVAGLAGPRLLFSTEWSSDYGLAHFPTIAAGSTAAVGWLVWCTLGVGLWLARWRSPRIVLWVAAIAAPLLLFSHLLTPLPTAFAERVWVLPTAATGIRRQFEPLG